MSTFKQDVITYCNSCGTIYDGARITCKECGDQPLNKQENRGSFNVGAYVGGHPNYPNKVAPATLLLTDTILIGATNGHICVWIPLENIKEVSYLSPDAKVGAAVLFGILGGVAGGRFYINIQAEDPALGVYNALFEAGIKSRHNFEVVSQIITYISAAAQAKKRELGASIAAAKLCPNCQKEVQEDFNACPYCGKKLKESKHCDVCNIDVHGEFMFCPKCGTEV